MVIKRQEERGKKQEGQEARSRRARGKKEEAGSKKRE